jgi:LEA14-like dessication related protein
MRKGWLIALGVLLLLGIGGYVYYNSLKSKARSEGGPYDGTLKPRLEMSRLSISNITDESALLNMNVLIDNPLPISFKARKVDYTLYIDNEEVAKDAYDKVIEVKSEDSTSVLLPIRLYTKKMVGVLKRLEAAGTDSTDYRIRTTFDMNVPIASERTFTVSQTMRAPVYHLPQFKVDDIDLGKFGLNRADVAARILCTNDNKFPFDISDAKYSVTIDGKQIAEGAQPEPILIKPQGTTPFMVPLTVKPGQSLGLLPKLLFKKEDTPVEVTFRCKIMSKSDNPMLKESQVATTIRGTVAELMKLSKTKKGENQ